MNASRTFGVPLLSSALQESAALCSALQIAVVPSCELHVCTVQRLLPPTTASGSSASLSGRAVVALVGTPISVGCSESAHSR